jgi:hypothetical protein
MSILIPLEAASDRDRHGAKAANLSFLVLKRMNVPEGRVLPVDAFARQVATCDPAANLADELASRPLSGELAAELRAIVTTLGGRVAVRSSATLEDGKTHSFAGQFLTVLNVGADGVEAAVRAVWASAFSDNVRAYLHRGDLDPRKLQMAVVLQRQLDSESSGVVMGRPGGVSVEAVWGQGEALVSGAVSADRWEVEGGRITNTRIATKYARVAVAAGAPTGSLSRIDLRDSERTRPSLTTNQVLEVAATCERLAEACEGRPQDCEFAYVSGKLHLLQTRDVTASLPVSAPPLGDFSPPGKGAWELNTSHFQRPCTAMFRSIFPENMAAGFKTGTERYGSLLSHVEFAFVNGFAYTRARLVAAPEDATAKPPPPAWLFKLLCTLVPALRKRLRTAKRIWTSQEWRRQLDEWQVAKASSIEEHLRLQSVPVDALDDAQLAEHFDRVCAHAGRMVQQHHSYNVAALLQMGDLICHAANWSQGQVSVADVVAVLRGASPISADLNSDEAREVGAALAACQVARQLLRLQPGDAAIADDAAERALEMLRALPGDVGDKMRRFLAMREFRLVEGIDPGVPCLRECPSLLWHALRSTALAVDTQVKSPPEQGGSPARGCTLGQARRARCARLRSAQDGVAPRRARALLRRLGVGHLAHERSSHRPAAHSAIFRIVVCAVRLGPGDARRGALVALAFGWTERVRARNARRLLSRLHHERRAVHARSEGAGAVFRYAAQRSGAGDVGAV